MRLLTIVALATVAAGLYLYRKSRTRPARDQQRATPDDFLAEQVRAGIRGAASARVEVRVSHGIVALRGTVRTGAERDQVLAAALAVPGVTKVTNHLETEEPVGEIGTMQSGIAEGV